MRPPRFRIRTLMVVVATVAAALSCLRSPAGSALLVLAVVMGLPIVAALIDRRLGGSGVLGGLLGGVAEFAGLLALEFAVLGPQQVPFSDGTGSIIALALFALLAGGFAGGAVRAVAERSSRRDGGGGVRSWETAPGPGGSP